MNRRLIELTEVAYEKAKRHVNLPWMRGKEGEAMRLRGTISEKIQKMREAQKQRGNVEEAKRELRTARRIYEQMKKQCEKEHWDKI